MRCDQGRALCGAVEEVRKDTETHDRRTLKPVRNLRQLEAIREALAEHDRTCFECSGGWFDPGDVNQHKEA